MRSIAAFALIIQELNATGYPHLAVLLTRSAAADALNENYSALYNELCAVGHQTLANE